MNAKLIGYGFAMLAVVSAIFGAGYWVAHVQGSASLATLQSQWDKERVNLANQRADAEVAQHKAEQVQADAIGKAAANYEQGKKDAEQNAKQAIADLDAGNRRLRDQWATCRTTSAAVSSAASGSVTDGEGRLREDGIRRVLSAIGQCQAQRDGLQQALTGERQ
jgi:hypothetical protein